jgi:hypothetical protein
MLHTALLYMSREEQSVSDAKKNSQSLKSLAQHVGRLSESGTVLVATSLLDTELERAIKAIMRPLNSELKGKLFKGYGPLATFSARIDIAYALKIVNKDVQRELHKMRDIRNAFAHTVIIQTLDSEKVRPLFVKLNAPTNPKSDHNLDVFIACVEDLLICLETSMGGSDDISKRARETLKEL